MFKKIVKKLALAATLVCMAGTFAAAAACNVETKHPKVRITVEFDSKSYQLDYTLYRNMYPNTVRRFIELVDNGYYSNMLVHDFRSDDWISGGYEYNASEYAASVQINALTDYLEEHSKEQEFMDLFNAGKISKTVYSEYAYDSKGNQVVVAQSAMPTLIGEFYNNINQQITNGELTAEFGTLKMYYYEKESTQKVYVDTKAKGSNIYMADYKNNCATTQFAMQISSSSSIYETRYCVFGKMEKTAALRELLDAIEDYYGDDVESVDVHDVNVDNIVGEYSNETADRGTEMDFTLPASPIIIKSVKVTKY